MMTSPGRATPLPAPPAATRRGPGIGNRVRTTPGRIRLLSLVAVAALVLAWAVEMGATGHRRSAVSDFGTRSEGLVVLSQRFQTDLAGADSSIADAFLSGGLEPPGLVRDYQQGVAAAATDAAAARADAAIAPNAGTALDTIARQLPVYTGLVERARADNRQGFPIGAAYLRSASSLLRQQLLPAAAGVAQGSGSRVNHARTAATALTDVLLVLGAGLVALVALVVLQWFVTGRTRRAVNIGAAAATIVALVTMIVVLAGMASERSAAVTAGEHAYATVAALTQARVLVFEAKGDESQALIALGSGQAFRQSFDVDVAAAGRLVADARRSATDPGAVDRAASALQRYVADDAAVRQRDDAGSHSQAVALAVGAAATDARAADAALTGAQTTEQAAFRSRTSSARDHLGALPTVASVGAILAVLLVLVGVQSRINEYR